MSNLKYKIGMVGNPIIPQTDWSDEQMATLKWLGFNMAQMNIAWDNRPNGEPLNLEHIEGETKQKC